MHSAGTSANGILRTTKADRELPVLWPAESRTSRHNCCRHPRGYFPSVDASPSTLRRTLWDAIAIRCYPATGPGATSHNRSPHSSYRKPSWRTRSRARRGCGKRNGAGLCRATKRPHRSQRPRWKAISMGRWTQNVSTSGVATSGLNGDAILANTLPGFLSFTRNVTYTETSIPLAGRSVNKKRHLPKFTEKRLPWRGQTFIMNEGVADRDPFHP